MYNVVQVYRISCYLIYILHVYASLNLFVYLCIFKSICLSIYISLNLSAHLSISICLPMYFPILRNVEVFTCKIIIVLCVKFLLLLWCIEIQYISILDRRTNCSGGRYFMKREGGAALMEIIILVIYVINFGSSVVFFVFIQKAELK